MNENDLLLSIVDELINIFSAKKLATELNIAVGTLNRWIKNKKKREHFNYSRKW